MKFAYSLKQKTKIAVLLFLIMACTILIRLLEDRSIKNMEKAFSSLYNDRLVPATDIFYISEKLYAKRFLLETFVYSDQNKLSAQQLNNKLKTYDKHIDTLLAKYEKTFLVKNEKNHLTELKVKLLENKVLEKNILLNANTLEKTALRKLYDSNAEQSFLDISNTLSQLTKVQTVVGEQLKEESQKIVRGTNLYSTLQLLIAIIIGALIVSILAASNVMNIRNDNFNLN
ncbi:MCP four helix bundle domain-containing protein [Pedobacter xixiisoli]|uniref:Four helix bundle sensory module for signal transduction n=1 Tax=Pedobacter xixiisoli TaxID=1476464 RepID=A0A286ADH7_9SPHI|nr:MCP four helix bundle domain-containing protein [Pedobacter xixiisoli]SOD19962.1 Four helix bundle sensory module for signal transduction [Pedobacter xixiisoli]